MNLGWHGVVRMVPLAKAIHCLGVTLHLNPLLTWRGLCGDASSGGACLCFQIALPLEGPVETLFSVGQGIYSHFVLLWVLKAQGRQVHNVLPVLVWTLGVGSPEVSLSFVMWRLFLSYLAEQKNLATFVSWKTDSLENSS